MNENINIVLASSSPRRRELLSQIGLDYIVAPSLADENITETDPEKLVLKLSEVKAREVAPKYPDCAVIGADTVVAAGGLILGKPKSRDEAFSMINLIKNNCHSVFTGVTIIKGDTVMSFACETKVYVYDMTTEEIEAYIDAGECMDKAGAYGIQGLFARYIEKIEGDYNNVVGLPVSRLMEELK